MRQHNGRAADGWPVGRLFEISHVRPVIWADNVSHNQLSPLLISV